MVWPNGSLAKIRLLRDGLEESVNRYLDRDHFRCLDLVIIGGGIENSREPWKRFCMTLYRLLGAYQFFVAMFKFVFDLHHQEDRITLYATVLVFVGFLICFVRIFTVQHNSEAIEQCKKFVLSRRCKSGDPDFDATVHKEASRTTSHGVLALILFFCCNQFLIWIPCAARDRVFGIPRQFHDLGPTFTIPMQQMFIVTLAFFWDCRLFYATIMMSVLLMGLRGELSIISHGFETLISRARHVQDAKRGPSPNAVQLEYLELTLKPVLKQHIEFLKIIGLLKPFVNYAFAITYYCPMILVAVLVYMLIRDGSITNALLCASTAMSYVLECYWWCYLIDSLQDQAAKIADSVSGVIFELSHSSVDHSGYLEMRTSLMIVQIYTSTQSGWFSCAGNFPVSIEAFKNF
ncbi:AAEL017000-PA, partial [Aedes aegypti]